MRPSLVIENRVASSKLVRLWRCVSDRVQPSNTDIGGLLARWEWPFTTWLCVTWSIMVWGQMRHNKTWIQIEESIFTILYLYGPDVFSYLVIFACFDIYCTHTIYIFFVPVMSGVYIWSYFVHESMHPLHTCMHMCGNPSIHPSVRTFMLAIIDVCVLWWQMEMAPLSHTGDVDDASSISLSQQVWGNPSESPKHTYKYKLAIIGANNQEAVCCTRMRKVMSDK